MTSLKIFIATAAISFFLSAPDPVFAQDGAKDGSVDNTGIASIEQADEKFTTATLQSVLNLEQHQVDFINELHKESQERLKNEKAMMHDNPGIFRNHALNIRRETRERIREVLHPDQLNIYEEYYAREIEREAQMMDEMPIETDHNNSQEHNADNADDGAK